jgi:hypothetical protein
VLRQSLLVIGLVAARVSAAEPPGAPPPPPPAQAGSAAAPAAPPLLPNAKRWQELVGEALQIDELQQARDVASAIESSTKLSPGARLAAKESLTSLEKDFDVHFAPMVAVVEKAVANKKRNEAEQELVFQRGRELQKTQPGPNASEGDIKTYEAKATELDLELKRVHDQMKRDNDTLAAETKTELEKLEKWLMPRVKAYVDSGSALLSGRVKDDGLAWKQLRTAAAGQRDPVFDNTAHQGVSDPSVVDTRGTVPVQTPEAQKKEQDKPRVEPYKKRPKTTDKAPPAPGK